MNVKLRSGQLWISFWTELQQGRGQGRHAGAVGLRESRVAIAREAIRETEARRSGVSELENSDIFIKLVLVDAEPIRSGPEYIVTKSYLTTRFRFRVTFMS